MKEVEVITIGNKNYIILNEVIENNISYIFLSNVEDPNDVMIRKSTKEDSNHYVPLENKEEFQLASLLLFQSSK